MHRAWPRVLIGNLFGAVLLNMSGFGWAHIFLLALCCERLIELFVAKRNEAWVRERGGVEYGRAFTRVLVLFHAGWFCAFAIEAYSRRAQLQVPWPVLAAAVLLLQAGRYWCVASLGRFWNVKVLVVPGAALVRAGPYRRFKHPNYLVVAAEIFAYPALFGCWATAVCFGAANLLVLRKRISQENEALEKSTEEAQRMRRRTLR